MSQLGSAQLSPAEAGSARLSSVRLSSARLSSARLSSAQPGSAWLSSAQFGPAQLPSEEVAYCRKSNGKGSCEQPVSESAVGRMLRFTRLRKARREKGKCNAGGPPLCIISSVLILLWVFSPLVLFLPQIENVSRFVRNF